MREAARWPYLTVGLTGGIASGKTLVAGLLQRLGIPVIDADPIGHELIRPGAPCYRPVLALLGRGVLGPGRRIVRRRVAEVVFARPALRRALNALMHPLILREAERRARLLSLKKRRPIVVVSAALLVEAGAARRFDRVVLVTCRRAERLRRLRRRDGLTRSQALSRLAAQSSDARRRRAADFVIDNSDSRAATGVRTRRVAEVLKELARRRSKLSPLRLRHGR